MSLSGLRDLRSGVQIGLQLVYAWSASADQMCKQIVGQMNGQVYATYRPGTHPSTSSASNAQAI